jgi:hypothetical protein
MSAQLGKFRFLLEPRLVRKNLEFDRNRLAASPAQFSPFLRVFLGLDPVLYGKSAGLDDLLERMVISFCLVSVGTRESARTPGRLWCVRMHTQYVVIQRVANCLDWQFPGMVGL